MSSPYGAERIDHHLRSEGIEPVACGSYTRTAARVKRLGTSKDCVHLDRGCPSDLVKVAGW